MFQNVHQGIREINVISPVDILLLVIFVSLSVIVANNFAISQRDVMVCNVKVLFFLILLKFQNRQRCLIANINKKIVKALRKIS